MRGRGVPRPSPRHTHVRTTRSAGGWRPPPRTPPSSQPPRIGGWSAPASRSRTWQRGATGGWGSGGVGVGGRVQKRGGGGAAAPPPPPPHSLTSRAPCPHNCRPGAASAWPAPRRSRPRLPPTWGQAPASLGDGGSASGCVRGGDAPRQADGGTRVERQRCTLATHPPLPPPRMPASRALQGLAAPHCLTPPIKWGAKSQLNGDQGGGEGEGWLLAAQLDQLRHHAGVGQRRHVAQLVLLLSQQVWQQVCCVGRWRGEL